MCVTAARNGNLYMTDVSGLVSRDRPVIVYPRSAEGFGPPQRVGGGVNAPTVADHAYIAPDESYILFDTSGRPGGQGGEGDLHACFRNPDGSWSEAFNLGDAINTPGTNFVPTVSPDGRYIFYMTGRDIYWVSAEILETLKPARTPEELQAQALRKLQEQRERLPLFYNDLLVLMDVRPGQAVADIGAGAGEFAIRLARTVGPEGRVFANEIKQELVDKLESLENRERLPQLSVILGGEDDPRLPEKVDRAFLNMVYHHLDRPDDFMARLLEYVKPGGLLAVSAVDIHIRKGKTSGPRDPCISDPEETRTAIEKAGWEFQSLTHPISYDEKYVLIFSAPSRSLKGYGQAMRTDEFFWFYLFNNF
jgi:SAM-dependent methyltransferase